MAPPQLMQVEVWVWVWVWECGGGGSVGLWWWWVLSSASMVIDVWEIGMVVSGLLDAGEVQRSFRVYLTKTNEMKE